MSENLSDAEAFLMQRAQYWHYTSNPRARRTL
jgi:hypothetical protein